MNLKRALEYAKTEARKLGTPLVVINDEIGEAEDPTGPYAVMPAASMLNHYAYGIGPGAEVVYTVSGDGIVCAAPATVKIKGEAV